MEFPDFDHLAKLPREERNRWIAARCLVLGVETPDDFASLSDAEVAAWLLAMQQDAQRSLDNRCEERDNFQRLIDLVEPIQRGRPQMPLGDALAVLAAQERLGNRRLRGMRLTKLCRIALRAMIRQTADEGLEPAGGREAQEIILQGIGAELRARRVSEKHAARLVTGQHRLVVAEFVRWHRREVEALIAAEWNRQEQAEAGRAQSTRR